MIDEEEFGVPRGVEVIKQCPPQPYGATFHRGNMVLEVISNKHFHDAFFVEVVGSLPTGHSVVIVPLFSEEILNQYERSTVLLVKACVPLGTNIDHVFERVVSRLRDVIFGGDAAIADCVTNSLY